MPRKGKTKFTSFKRGTRHYERGFSDRSPANFKYSRVGAHRRSGQISGVCRGVLPQQNANLRMGVVNSFNPNEALLKARKMCEDVLHHCSTIIVYPLQTLHDYRWNQ